MASGLDSPQAEALKEALKAALECGHDADERAFTNNCEAVLARLDRSLTHVCQKRFADEEKILDGLSEKERAVRFMLDCVRNRFLLWKKVATMKEKLCKSKSWQKAFDSVMRTAPYNTVDLGLPPTPTPPPTPSVRRPIPFCLELAAVLGLLFPLFALSQGCDCLVRWVLFAIGMLLFIAWVVFELLLRSGSFRGAILRRFIVGDYALDAERIPLNRFWHPSTRFFKPPIPVTNTERLSFGYWFKYSWPVARATVKPADGKLHFSCSAMRIDTAGITMDEKGALVGLPRGASFNGVDVLFLPEREGGVQKVWSKVNGWRLDVVRKILMSLAALGCLMAVTAGAFQPGLQLECLPTESVTTVTSRIPMKVYFLLDASGSVGASAWQNELKSTVAWIDAFAKEYGPEKDKIYVGVAQFSTKAKEEVGFTNNLTIAKNQIRQIRQDSGGTNFEPPLKLCQQKLTAFSQPGPKAYEMCVLTTDGASSDKPSDLWALLSNRTHLIGIYVGSNAGDSKELQNIVCFHEPPSPSPCRLFVSAANFAELVSRAGQLAANITKDTESSATRRDFTYPCDPPPLWSLWALLLLLPLMLWWCYLHVRCRKEQPPAQFVHRDPDRILLAGANQSRPRASEAAPPSRAVQMRESLGRMFG
eukprot:TRINITY_DN59204_c0_g1_i1.p1 TRINITY_DN59204_c0_g1~~TRINITY_DN59204_c0_g1_i1.p1  ORF type:complete len:647 (+),score=91.57 TRINITY_DN59204_c0_g1_i1:85-2025(+)